MSGRKRRTRSTQPERIRRLRNTQNDLAFDLTTPDPSVELGVTPVAGRGDRVHWQVRFEPPMSREHAAKSYVTIVHVPTKRSDMQLVVLPHTNEKFVAKVAPEHNYLVFPTHAAQLDGMCISGLYLVICNVQMQGDVDMPLYEIEFRPQEHERYIELPYYPPVTIPGLAIDASNIPQSVPLPIRTHRFSGSRVPRLLGFYAGQDQQISGWRAVSVRFGVHNETRAIMLYLDQFPKRIFEQTGYHESEHGGCMPDGLVTDEESNTGAPGFPELDCTKGLIEVKSSRNSPLFMGSDFAQCIWELMVCKRAWGDILRYSEHQRRNKISGLWETVRNWRVVRLYRSAELESRILYLVQQSSVPFVDNAEFQEMRTHLENMASEANTLHSTEYVANTQVLLDMDAYKTKYYEEHRIDVPTLDPVLDRIEKRQAIVFDELQKDRSSTRFHTAVLEQLHDYVELIK